MKEPRSRSFGADASEPQLRRAIGRSGSSEPLLESPPSSHRMAAATGDDEVVMVTPNPQKPATVAYYYEEEAITASHEQVAVVDSPGSPPSPTVVAEGCGGGQGKGAPGSYEGRLFSNKVSSVGDAGKGEGTSSREVEEQEREGKKGKQKKRWSWMPDPEKRWPVQGWS